MNNTFPSGRFPAVMSIFLLVVVMVGGILIFQQSNDTEEPARDITVAASIFPLADIARNIAGNHADVVQLVPSGASPHSYSLTPQDLQRLGESKVLFAIGHGIDDWSAGSAVASTNTPLVVVDRNISLRELTEPHNEEDDHEAGSIDPHYWLSVDNAKNIATTIADELRELDPEHADNYAANLASYLDELDTLQAELTAQSKNLSQRNFLAIHDAWSYFAGEYNLALIGTYEPIEGREPSIADIASLRELITNTGITTFYTEPQKQSSNATRLMQTEFGLQILVLDPLGGVGVRDSYSNLMRYNMQQIAKGAS